MSTTPDERNEREERLIRFLLGTSGPEERDDVERRLFEEDAFHEEVRATADDLSAAYLRGVLSAADRDAFEAHFLASPRNRERVLFMRSLLQAIDRTPAQPGHGSRRWVWGALAAALFVAVVAGGTLLRDRAPGPQVAAPASPFALPSSEATLASPSPLPAQTPAPPHVERVLVLKLRASTPGRPLAVALVPETRVVRIEVPVPPAGPPSYDAVLRTADGREVWRAEDLAPRREGDPVIVDVPSTAFRGDSYRFALEGEEVRDGGSPPPRTLEFVLRILRGR